MTDVDDRAMHLLVAVVSQPEKLDEILSGFVELGVRGATVINSEGMGRVPATVREAVQNILSTAQAL